MSIAGPEVFNGTVFAPGYWCMGGGDYVGTYGGGVAGTTSATLTGTLTQVGDTATAQIGGRTITLRAYSDIPNGVLFTTLDYATFYAFLRAPFQSSQTYALSYTVAGNSGLACFVAGSRIATERGEVPVEELRIGDRVALARRVGYAPIRWLGRRRMRPAPPSWPVRILAGAFAPGQPHRDLLLSPDHAVATASGLVPVRCLVNGATIAPLAMAQVEYWHVELPFHELILAEGLAVESYLDTGNRSAFEDVARVTAIEPERVRQIWQQRGRAPLVLNPAALAPVRRHLLVRAAMLGYTLTADPGLRILADGLELHAVRKGMHWETMLPSGVCEVRLCSRTAVPPAGTRRSRPCTGRMATRCCAAAWLPHRDTSASASRPCSVIGRWHPHMEMARRRRWSMPPSPPREFAGRSHRADTI